MCILEEYAFLLGCQPTEASTSNGAYRNRKKKGR